MTFTIVDEASFVIIPAPSGWCQVYESPEDHADLWAGEPIIAWRVETRPTTQPAPGGNAYTSAVFPLGVDGEPAMNCVGAQFSDGLVILFGRGVFNSLEDAAEANTVNDG